MNVLLCPGIQLGVIPVEKVADDCSTLELITSATLCDDVVEVVRTYVEQQRGKSISLVDGAHDVNLCSWLLRWPVELSTLTLTLTQSQIVFDEGC